MPLIEEENRYIPGEEKYWVAWSRIAGVGPAYMRKLADYFGGLEAAWQAKAADLMAAGLSARLIERALAFRKEFDPDKELAKLAKAEITVLTLESPDYPFQLAQTEGAPAVLYLKGELLPVDDTAVAVVGTRKMTGYGRSVTQQFTEELARHGVTIVSGLARGVDTVAHETAIKAEGRTLAVLGCGIDIIYPPENRKLAEQIIKQGQGAIISEHPPGVQPLATNFPARNRIISGLVRGVLIVESGIPGGAMGTVKFANEQGRDVFAVPGSIFNNASVGPNKLIKDGATAVVSASDIIAALHLGELDVQVEVQEILGDNEIERSLIRTLAKAGGEAQHIDDICRESGLNISVVSSNLAIMELKGKIRNQGSMRYALAGRAK